MVVTETRSRSFVVTESFTLRLFASSFVCFSLFFYRAKPGRRLPEPAADSNVYSIFHRSAAVGGHGFEPKSFFLVIIYIDPIASL